MRTVKLKYIIPCLLAFLFLFITGGGVINAYASASSYSDVISDLRADKDFNMNDYPAGGTEYKIDLFQIAESTEGELFLYCYQPYGKLTASSVSISKTIGDNYAPRKYTLNLLSYGGVFYKYLVVDFTLESEALRYYNISQIWRKYDKQIDGSTSGSTTVNEVPYAVGKLFTATTVGGEVSYTMKGTETVEIINPLAGFVRHSNGVKWANTTSCDAHFIAFSTNYDITRLISADVTYKTQTYKKTVISGTKYSEISEAQYVTVNHDEKTGNSVNGLFATKYNWDRISRTSDFIKEANITEDNVQEIDDFKELKRSQWVLSFLETTYTVPAGFDDYAALIFGGLGPWLYVGFDMLFSETSGTLVKEVAVLRLEFEVDGKVYNLGTVSKVVTGSDKPFAENKNSVEEGWDKFVEGVKDVPWWVWVLIAAVVVIIVLIILSVVFPAVGQVISVILKVFTDIFKGIWFVICMPFKWIASLVTQAQERKTAAAAAEKKSSSSGKKKTTAKKSSTTTTTKKKTAAEGKKKTSTTK